jgi:hypothetical protein
MEWRTSMSYDLMVFDPTVVPHNHAQFMEWYAKQILWDEDHTYNDPTESASNLRAWFTDIIQFSPPMNGPFSDDQLPEDEASTADYSIGRSVIYVAFAWSKSKLAYQTAFDLAQKHGLGFFNVSSGSEEVWLFLNGKCALVHTR